MAAHAADIALETAAVDTRFNLKLTPSERTDFLAQMRGMLSSIQHIMIGIGTSDRAKTPPAFQAIGGGCPSPGHWPTGHR